MEESKERPRASRFCTTRGWLVVWAVSSSIVVLASYLVRPYVYYDNEFSVLVNAMNVISYVLAIGLPVFLPASIVFGTSASRAHISALLKSGKSTFVVFLRCLIEVYGLILLFSVSISSVLFLEPPLVGTSFHRPEGTGFLIYLPQVLIATLVVSLLLASVGVIFVMITDDIIISTIMGCVLTIGLASLLGWNSHSLWESLTRGLAMFSPSNLARIFAASLSGYDSADSFTIASYFGFTATMSSILLALTIFGFIVFIGLIVSIKVFQNNTRHGIRDGGPKKSLEIWESEPERREEHAKIKQRMNIRRLALVGLIMIMLTITALGSTSYANTVVADTTIIFHQSPEGGEQINLGDWYVFSCDVRPPQYGVSNILHYECIFEDWRDCPDELSFYYCMVNISSSDFQLLNETGRRSICGDAMNYTQDDWGFGGGGWNIGFDYGPYTFALKAIAAENETISGFLYCAITLSQSPTFY